MDEGRVRENVHNYRSMSKHEVEFLVNEAYEPVIDAISSFSSDETKMEEGSCEEELYDSGDIDFWITYSSDYDWREVGRNNAKEPEEMVLGVLDYWGLVDVKGGIHDRSSTLNTSFSLDSFEEDESRLLGMHMREFYESLDLTEQRRLNGVLEKVENRRETRMLDYTDIAGTKY